MQQCLTRPYIEQYKNSLNATAPVSWRNQFLIIGGISINGKGIGGDVYFYQYYAPLVQVSNTTMRFPSIQQVQLNCLPETADACF